MEMDIKICCRTNSYYFEDLLIPRCIGTNDVLVHSGHLKSVYTIPEPSHKDENHETTERTPDTCEHVEALPLL